MTDFAGPTRDLNGPKSASALLPRPTISLRARIILLTCAVGLLTATLLGALAYHRSGEIALQTSKIAFRGETRLLAQRLDATLTDIGDDLRIVVNSPSVESLFRALKTGGVDPVDGSSDALIVHRLHKLFGAVMLSQTPYRTISVTGLWGSELVMMERSGSGLEVKPKGPAWNGTMPDWISEASRSMRPGEVRIVPAATAEGHRTRFITPITASGSVVALLHITVATEDLLSPLLKEAGQTTGVFALDPEIGTERLAGPPLDLDDIVSDMDRDRLTGWSLSGGYDEFAAEKSNALIFAASIPPRPWISGMRFGVASLVDRETLIAPAVKARSDTLFMVLVLVTIATGASVVMAGLLAKPLTKLTQIVSVTQDSGGLQDLPTDRSDEIGDLSRAVGGLAQRLANAESHAREVLDTVDDAVVTSDISGRIVTINPAGREMFPDADVGAIAANVLPVPHLDKEGAPIGEAGPTIVTEDDGTTRHFEVVLGRQAAGRRKFATAVIRDVTTAKEVELLKEQFLGIVSHELRTPLTAINASLILLRHGMVDSARQKEQHLLGLALSNTQRLARLVDDILAMEKARSGQLKYDIQTINVAPFLQNFVESQSALANAHKVKFDFASMDSGLRIDVDPDRLEQIVLNLLSNAAKFSPAGSTISISLGSVDGTSARISIADEGPGIAPEFRDRIFQPFTSDDSQSNNVQAGTGLGLNISRTMVEAMRGQISFTCKENLGTIFHVTFPLSGE